ncbi:kinase-like protein [Aspergillus uvarum CBS 121591]|uniref:non-specific serine/threonine protein kinase n=1 Tax=Aspergillus uvarum CBS 121591 TaxID=1448315 RepID=A0A319C1J0_9EURO|nr:kinase-like protein [Aspergillus uvarum CBS 121591]PYH78067.1 kinase-like protein [Aspergillus uvarum CBS 121591]
MKVIQKTWLGQYSSTSEMLQRLIHIDAQTSHRREGTRPVPDLESLSKIKSKGGEFTVRKSLSAYYRLPARLPRVISSNSCLRWASRAMSSFIGEENQSPNYDPRKYYPARVGETIARRDRILSKLGWGADSTVWLAKDTSRSPNRYVTLKITNCGEAEQRSANEEVEISRYISQLQSNHEGRAYVRLVCDSFRISRRGGRALMFGKHLGSNGVPTAVLKPFLKMVLQGLDFLHSECHLIHTDRLLLNYLKADNLLVGFEDLGVLESYARQQESNPAPSWDGDGRPVFRSCPDFGHLRKGVGLVQISDFSAAVFGNVPEPHNYGIQPQPFCAPEVLLKATWTYSADIWNLGTMLWELLADRVLLDGLDPTTSTCSREKHIAQMIRLLEPPPLQLLKRADRHICSELFSSSGMISVICLW